MVEGGSVFGAQRTAKGRSRRGVQLPEVSSEGLRFRHGRQAIHLGGGSGGKLRILMPNLADTMMHGWMWGRCRGVAPFSSREFELGRASPAQPQMTRAAMLSAQGVWDPHLLHDHG